MSEETFEQASPQKPSGRDRASKRVEDLSQRLPPHSVEMEKATLGCIFISPNECLDICAHELSVGPEVFYDLRNRTIYALMLEMREKKLPVDLVTVSEQLKNKNTLEGIGGIEYLNSLSDSSHSAANLTYYTDVLRDKHVLRKILAACVHVTEKVYDESFGIESALEAFDNSVSTVQSDRRVKGTLNGVESSSRMMVDLERRFELQGKLSGLDTGLIDFNKMTEGLQFGEQTIIGARPSMGKTALGLGIFREITINQKIPALFISLEMSVEALMRRLLAAEMAIPLCDVRRGSYTEEQFRKFTIFKEKCKKSPIHIIDGVSGLGCREVCATIRRMVMQFGIKMVVVDYLQKIKPDTKHEKRTYEVGEVSGKLKAVAVETNVALVTMAQLNRENVNQKGRPPRLSDLADSGQIERDADLVALIHRERDKNLLIIAKQRDGETGIVPVYFDATYCRFLNNSSVSEDDASRRYQD